MTFSCRLGEAFPDFFCMTTQGEFSFHEYLTSNPDAPWTLLFSHPADFTPVCTTEIGRSLKLLPRFTELGVKLIGISCDSLDSHRRWLKDILFIEEMKGDSIPFPIISDPDRVIVQLLGMLDSSDLTSALPVRSVFLIDKDFRLRLAFLYPSVVGRSYEEIIRAIEGVIITQREKGLATPVEWKSGDDFLILPEISTDNAKKRFGNIETLELPSGLEYMRFLRMGE